MKKYFIGLGIVALALTAYATVVNKAPVLGNTGSRGLRIQGGLTASSTTSGTILSTATSTAIYFGVGGTKTATTTLLMVGCNTPVAAYDPTLYAGSSTPQVSGPNNLGDIDTLGVYAQASASSSASIIYIYPQVSLDCVDWYDMSSLSDQVTTSGSAVNTVTLPSASTTVIAWTPVNGFVNAKTMFTMKNLATRAIRFNVWVSTASSTVWLESAAVERLTR